MSADREPARSTAPLAADAPGTPPDAAASPSVSSPTSSSPSLPREQRLEPSGRVARLEHDELTDSGVMLSIDGAEQSHVEVSDPSFLLHDYTFRIASACTTLGPLTPQTSLHTPSSLHTLSVLHLGAGALTLPRWLEAERPHTAQTVVDYEGGLVDFVLDALPMARAPRNLIADAAAVLEDGGELAGERFDVVVVDLFNGSDAPEPVISADFFATLLTALEEPGRAASPHTLEDDGESADLDRSLLLLNLGDVPGMAFARSLVHRVVTVLAEAYPSLSAWDHALLSAPADVVEAEAEGNLVLTLRPFRAIESRETQALWAAGPHPGEVLTGNELRSWADGPAAAEGPAEAG